MLHHKNTSCQLFIFLKNLFMGHKFIFIIVFLRILVFRKQIAEIDFDAANASCTKIIF